MLPHVNFATIPKHRHVYNKISAAMSTVDSSIFAFQTLTERSGSENCNRQRLSLVMGEKWNPTFLMTHCFPLLLLSLLFYHPALIISFYISSLSFSSTANTLHLSLVTGPLRLNTICSTWQIVCSVFVLCFYTFMQICTFMHIMRECTLHLLQPKWKPVLITHENICKL